MIPILLAACLVAPPQNDVVVLKHATKHETTLGPNDPVLEGIGPSKTFRYELEAEDSVLFVWAAADEADLVVLAKPEELSGAAALLSGKKPQKTFEDDDSGGGSTPFLCLERKGGGTFTIQVAAKRPAIDTPLTLHCFEARETSATRAAAAAARSIMQESQRLVEAGELDAARKALAEALPEMLKTNGAELSDALHEAAWDLGEASYRLGDLPTTRDAWARAHQWRSRTLPEDHPVLRGARWNLAVTFYTLGDLQGARALQERVLEVLSRTLPEDHFDLQAARRNLAITLEALGDLQGARALQERVLEVLSRTLPEDHPDLQTARGNLALTLSALGDLEGARALFERVLEVRSRTLPEDHFDLQTARGNLALTLSALGDLEGARALFERVLEVRSRTLPEDHFDLRATRGSLAITLEALGDLEGARALQERVLEVLSRTLPEDHPDLQKARQNLALTILALGDLEGARTLFERVLEVRSRTLPEDHPDLQWARGNLAVTIGALGDLEGARALQERVLEVLTRTLPEDHFDLQKARQNLANALKALGDFEGARALQERVLEVRSRTLPGDHPDLQWARGNLALTIRALGDLPGARALQEQALEVLSRTLPDDHYDLQVARGNLAGTIEDFGDLQGARVLRERVLEVFSRTLRVDHPELQKARLNLASTLFDLGDLPGARALEEQVLEVRSRTLPGDHPKLQKARLNLAITIRALGDLPGARALQEQALEVLSRTLPGDHPDLQLARENLACTLYDLGDRPGAHALFEQVLEARSRTLPGDHLDLQTARLNLANTIGALGDLQGARALEEQVLEVVSLTLPGDHSELQRARGNLAGTLSALGDLSGARALQEQVLEVRSRTLPGDHPDLQQARTSLARSRALTGDAKMSQELARELALTTSRKGLSLDSILEKQLVGERSVCTTLSIASGAGAFEADAEGERLSFSMCEAVRGVEASAARLQRSLGADADAWVLRSAIVRTSRKLNELAGSRSESHSRFADLARERDRLRRELIGRLEETGADRVLPELEASAIAGRLSPNEAAVAYWRYHRWEIDPETRERTTTASYLAWVLRPEGELRRIELGPAVAIEDAIDAWRRGLGAPVRGITRKRTLAKDQDELAQKVRSLIVDPILAHVGDSQRLWIAPSEAIHLVPVDALPDAKGLLGDRFEIVQLGALSELTIKSPETLLAPSVLALGGIRYDGEAEPFVRVEPKIAAAREVDSKALASSRGASESTLRGQRGEAYAWTFGFLPGTRAEAEVVEEYFLQAFEESDAPEPTILTRARASRDAFEALAPKHRYIHLATHGWFAPESVASTADDRVIDERMNLMAFTLRDQVIGLAPSLLCGLAFAGANGEADKHGRVRGVMTAEEIGAMDLTGVELCVLSACETNVGLRRGGQGIASLQTALHAAGVRTAITSLWKVDDHATLELMTEFYRRLWILKEPKAKALWNAKRKLREQLDGEGKPIYSIRDWAGWVLSGDPD